MLKDIKAVIFDLDGTLIDSMWMWKDIDVEYLQKYGVILPEDLQRKIEGMSFSETANYFKEKFSIPDSIDKIKDTWNTMARDKYANEVPMKVGVMDFLNFLKNKGFKTGIATSNSIELVELILETHQIKHYFDSIHTSCEVEKGKPAPDIYELVAKDLNVLPKECLVFEDVVQGIMAGKNAGMKVCAVYDDYSKDMDSEKMALADYYIQEFTELLDKTAHM